MVPEQMVLAVRDYDSHTWTLLEEVGSGRDKKTMKLNCSIFDRQIVGVLDAKCMTAEQMNEITASMFETEWDKYCQQKGQKKKKESSVDRDLAEPLGGIHINFNHGSSQS